jgi:hypothetical protein
MVLSSLESTMMHPDDIKRMAIMATSSCCAHSPRAWSGYKLFASRAAMIHPCCV